MKKILLCSALALLISVPAIAAEKEKFDYAGVKTCKKCHRKVWKTWKDTPMAESFTILKPGERAEMKTKAGLDPKKDYTKDATCLPCHTTGYGKPGGFVSVEKTPTTTFAQLKRDSTQSKFKRGSHKRRTCIKCSHCK